MELNRRSLLAAIGAGAAAAALGGCGTGTSTAGSADGPAEGEITLLTPIYEGADGKTLLEQEILGGFRKKHPKVKVNVDYTTYAQLNEKITTGLAGGLLPDVLMMGVGWIPPFAAKKAIAELPEKLASAHDYEKRVLEPSRYDGRLYALPVVLDTRIVVYRKDHFAAAGIRKTPANWAELRAVAKQLTKDGRLGFDPFSIDLRQCWETFLFANGGRLFSADGKKVLFNNARGVEALQFFKDLVKDGSSDYAKKTDLGAPSNIQTGKASMMMSTSALWNQLKDTNPELIEGDKVGAFILANRKPAMLQGGTLVSQSASSRHPAAARALVEHLATPESILGAAKQRGSVPGLKDLNDTTYVKENKFVDLSLQSMGDACSEGGTAAWMEIREKIKPTLEPAIVGGQSAKDAIAELGRLAEAAIGRM
ncbi:MULTISPECIES: ABC transporter substrate-binding protein [unclassified Streptomyces]|uniref:ABC transporter substrate-binding protein n=1 Tax=unclassified Streptomyces TaxID=2593676 RepID=UPI002DD826BE|nr:MULTISPECIES: ABC transporter substrate-binding protein [unclassified Streptomyces]WSC34797.1 ABC transporter substrate-binding protein [Streptomyces sp. NBC_01763]WSC57932.1 ABC transporter substrate-binding protein [Streptomyces sp. NBC_01761]WSF89033.1 ABC transporter substrate-binding protein [Streptomyces sp. NBC_01744]WSJ55238.1 ABC transporter substrate-binding protein [Streptomyces sp. NBC_01318]